MARFVRALPYVGLFLLAVQLAVWLPMHIARTDDVDYITYHDTALNLARGARIYEPAIGFLYPPTFAAMIRPAAALSRHGFRMIWFPLTLAAFWLYAWGLARLAFERVTWRHVFGVAVVVVVAPGTATTMSYGNADAMVWALVAWGVGGRPLALALGAAMKIYPGAGLAVVAWRQGLRGPVLATVALIGGAMLAIGTGPFVEWWRAGAMPLPPWTFSRENISLPIGVLRVLGRRGLTPGDLAFLRLFALAGIGTVVWLTRRWSVKAGAIAAVIAAVWCAPICWWCRAPIALVAVAAWYRTRSRVGVR